MCIILCEFLILFLLLSCDWDWTENAAIIDFLLPITNIIYRSFVHLQLHVICQQKILSFIRNVSPPHKQIMFQSTNGIYKSVIWIWGRQMKTSFLYYHRHPPSPHFIHRLSITWYRYNQQFQFPCFDDTVQLHPRWQGQRRREGAPRTARQSSAMLLAIIIMLSLLLPPEWKP